MKILWSVMLKLTAVVLLTVMVSCNTIRGLGRDIERGGEEIQDATRD